MPHKTSLLIPDKVWFPFKLKAAKEYKFEKGYTSKGAITAMRIWVELDKLHGNYEDLLEIEKKKHPNYARDELVKSVFEEARSLYIEKNKEYL